MTQRQRKVNHRPLSLRVPDPSSGDTPHVLRPRRACTGGSCFIGGRSAVGSTGVHEERAPTAELQS